MNRVDDPGAVLEFATTYVYGALRVLKSFTGYDDLMGVNGLTGYDNLMGLVDLTVLNGFMEYDDLMYTTTIYNMFSKANCGNTTTKEGCMAHSPRYNPQICTNFQTKDV